MFTILVSLIVLLALLLCVIILIQSGKGGGLAASFGGASSSTDSFMGGRQAATVLTKLTWIGGGVFLFLALVLAVLSSRPVATPESVLREGLSTGTPLDQAPTSVLDVETAPEPGDATEESAGGDQGEGGTTTDDEGDSGGGGEEDS